MPLLSFLMSASEDRDLVVVHTIKVRLEDKNTTCGHKVKTTRGQSWDPGHIVKFLFLKIGIFVLKATFKASFGPFLGMEYVMYSLK